MSKNRYCLALDLKTDPVLIGEYERWHQDVWPEIKESLRVAGIVEMEIYRISNRLFMIMETNSSFSFERKAAMDQANEKVQEWEQLMWKYQQGIPGTVDGQKWVLMHKMFSL
ncbi:L-rhamnose mutarotase [Rufibacter tibetensis]|uniref:L-fucose mutarotase n=1 Tax=Rufibacter tibetensis TaxID=512763 RepID=A0A0P0D3Z2_9BACT|nr:L-rhamnose mutarotase [Rufibacter tibetensis]ALJ01646.1 L-fucose mutarotase [Rufibacter tibetensis]